MKNLPHRLSLLVCTLTVIGALTVPPIQAEPGPTVGTTNLADRLCRGYEALNTVSCGIRKTSNSIRVLSRIYYKKPDRVHVQNVIPSRRRIVADGTKLYYHEDGAPKGFCRPIPELSNEWLTSLRNVPGTAMKYLLPLRQLPEEALPAAEGMPIRRAYATDTACAVLSCDKEGKLVRLEYFRTPKREVLMARYDFEDFQKAAESCWIPRLHKGTIHLPGGEQLKETSIVDALTVNEPIADRLFVPDTFFRDVVFSPDFKDTYAVPPKP